jgi:EAL and modified HD-GYP domain-containing signal transduction protein
MARPNLNRARRKDGRRQMDVFVARQPIFNRHKKLFAYELLFRNGMANFFPEVDGDQASCNLLANAFLSIGIEELTGGRLAFVNFTQDLLVRQIPSLFPRDTLMVEVLEDVRPDPSLIAACRQLAAQGYPLVLDDFTCARELDDLLRMAAIVKIDFLGTPADAIPDLVASLAAFDVKLLAEKVETHEAFQAAREMGFVYFQGYFFSRPEILKGRDIAPGRLQLLQLIAEINRRECRVDKLEELVKTDVSLSYKLLRYINSAFFRRAREINTIKHAIVLLGLKETRKFISMIATGALAAGKPNELIRTSIIRAKICESIGAHFVPAAEASEMFLMGLFSLMDAILDCPMAAAIENLPLSATVCQALLKAHGPAGDLLRLVRSYESGQWEDCQTICDQCRFDAATLPAHYRQSVGWAHSFPFE